MIFGKEFELNCRLRILTTPIASLEINTNVIKFFYTNLLQTAFSI